MSHSDPAGAAWVAVANFATVLQAEIARQNLAAEGITAVIAGQRTGIFGPGHQGPVPGGVDLCVPSPEVDHARRVLDSDGGPRAPVSVRRP